MSSRKLGSVSPLHFKALQSWGLAGIGSAIAIAALPVSAQAASLTAWSFDPNTNHLEVTVKDGTTPRYFLMAQPARIVMDLPGTSIAGVKTQGTYGGAVRQIRVSQFQPGMTRIVLELSPGVKLASGQVNLQKKDPTRWVLKPLLAEAVAVTPVTPTPVTPDPVTPTPVTSPTRAQSSQPTAQLTAQPMAQPIAPSAISPAPRPEIRSVLRQPTIAPSPSPIAVPPALAPASTSPVAIGVPPLSQPASSPAAPEVPTPEGIPPVPQDFAPQDFVPQALVSVPPISSQSTSQPTRQPANQPASPPANPSASLPPSLPGNFASAAPAAAPPVAPPVAQSRTEAPLFPLDDPAARSTPDASLFPTPTAPASLRIPATLAVTPPKPALTNSGLQALNPNPAEPPGSSTDLGPTTAQSLPAPLQFATPGTPTSDPIDLPQSQAAPITVPPLQPLLSIAPAVPTSPQSGVIDFGQPLPGSRTPSEPLRSSSGRTSAGTLLSLRYPGTTALRLRTGTPHQEVLLLQSEIRDGAGNLIAPKDSLVIGRFETSKAGSRFIAQAISIQGRSIPLAAQSEILTGTLQVSDRTLAVNSGIGAIAGGIVGGFSGAGLAGGAATGAAVTLLTSPKPATVQPGQIVQVRLLQDFQ
jgi:hypothetical protein